MPWGAIAASVAGPLIGGLFAGDAENGQQAASDAAIAEQRRQYDLNREDYAPWRQAGGDAINRLRMLLGLGSDDGSGNFGSLNKKFSMQDFLSDPITQASYKSGLDLGTQALDRMAGARGSRNSGAQLKALNKFGTDYTNTKAGESYGRFYGDQDRTFNRLSGVAGSGQTAVTNGANINSGISNNIGNILTGQGNARGASAISQGNMWGNAANNLGNYFSQQSSLDKILGSGGGWGYGD